MVSAKNGTTEHSLALLEHIYPKASSTYDFHIAVNSAANKYFSLSDRYQNVIITDCFDLPVRFDCIYVPYQIFEYEHLFMLNRFGLKYIVDILDIISVRSNYLRHKDLKPIFRTAITYADGILFNTSAVWEDIQNYFLIEKKNQIVSPMHISKSCHHDSGFKLNEYEKKIADGLPDGFIFIIGNSYYHKALGVALKHIKSDHSIVTFGCDKKFIEQFDIDTKNITFIESGNLSDDFVNYLYQKCKCIVFPSQYEGFGLPVLSAMLYNKPVILFNSSTNREVTANFQDKRLFHFFDHFNELNFKIKQAYAMQCDDKHKKPPVSLAREWHNVADETINFIDDVLNKPVDPHALEERNQRLTQIELIYKTTIFGNLPIGPQSRSSQFMTDIPRAWQLIKREGVLKGLYRLFWYIQGVRMPTQK